jgi:hypothetical protein
MALLVALVVMGILGSCTPEVCSPERLPNHGHSVSVADLVSITQVAAKNECNDVIYQRMSRRTRDEHFQIAILHVWYKPINDLLVRGGWTRIEELGDTSTNEIVRDGRFISSRQVLGRSDLECVLIGWPASTSRFIFQVLVKLENDLESRLPEWFLAIEEQIRMPDDFPPMPGLPPRTPPPDERPPGGRPK